MSTWSTSFLTVQEFAHIPKACATVIADDCNPSLIDPAEKVSPLMLNLYLRAESATGAMHQHTGL